MLALAIPFGVLAVRLATSSGHVFLSDDLALIDLNVKDALHFRQQLGPWDRFGWRHPGASYFYLLALVARAFGSGARADFLGAALINGLSALGIVWLMHRAAGRWPALWSALCVGALATILTVRTPVVAGHVVSEASIGVIASPWNPYVVILPLTFFAALCAVGAAGSWPALVGGAVVGSFVVQSNIGTLPFVAALLVAALGVRFVPVLRTRFRARTHGVSSATVPTHDTPRRAGPFVLLVGLLVLLVMWLPTILEQATNHPGNLTLIWRFFASHHRVHSLSRGLQAIGSIDGAPTFALSHPFLTATTSSTTEFLALAGVVAIGILGVSLGIVRSRPLAVLLASASLLGLAVAMVSATRVVGPVANYLMCWELSVPVLAILAVGIAVVADEQPTPSVHSPATAPTVSTRRAGRPVVLVVLVVLVAGVLTGAMVRLPSLSGASDPTVGSAWRVVAPSLPGARTAIELGLDSGTPFYAFNTMIGLFDQLETQGYDVCVGSFWTTAVGKRHVCRGAPEVEVLLAPLAASTSGAHGIVGHTADYVIRVIRSTSSGSR